MIKKVCILLLCTSLVAGQESADADEGSGENGSIRILAKLLNDCSRKEDISVCFKVKAVNFLGRLLRSPNALPITDSIALSRDSTAAADESNQTEVFTSEQDLEASLPRSLDKKNEKLDEIMWTMFKNLISTRTLEYTPSDENFEGRRKNPTRGGGKKNNGLMMMATMMMGMMMKLALGKIALLAGKALIVGKIALVLALVLALKKMSGGGGESHPQVVYATAEHGSGGSSGGWQRRYSDAQTLAYGSQR